MSVLPPIPYQKGKTLKQANNDILDCQVAALQKVPSNTAVYTTPKYTTPVECSESFGSVSCTGGQTTGGNVVSYDANTQLRQRVTEQCMDNRGYKIVDYAICPRDAQKKMNKKIAQEGEDLDQKMIPPSENSCAYVHKQKTIVLDLTNL